MSKAQKNIYTIGEIMKIKDSVLHELNAFEPRQFLSLYEYVVMIKRQEPQIRNPSTMPDSYLRVRKLLENCKGCLSDDIIDAKADRV